MKQQILQSALDRLKAAHDAKQQAHDRLWASIRGETGGGDVAVAHSDMKKRASDFDAAVRAVLEDDIYDIF